MKRDIKHLLYGAFFSLFVWVFGGALTIFVGNIGYSFLASILCLLTIFFGSYGLVFFF